jgi:hypothetical protein
MNMPDAATSAALAAWTQAAIYFITFLVLWRQLVLFRRQLRASEKSKQDRQYLRAQTDFTDSLRLLISSGTHSGVYDSLCNDANSDFVNWRRYSPADKVTYSYFELLYEMFERVFVMWKEGWIPEQEWHYWKPWIADVIRHPLLQDVFRDNRGMFDARFETFMEEQFQNIKMSEQGDAANPRPCGTSVMPPASAGATPEASGDT